MGGSVLPVGLQVSSCLRSHRVWLSPCAGAQHAEGRREGVRAGAPRSPTRSVSTGAPGWEGCSRTCLVGGAPCCRSSSWRGTRALGAHGLSSCLSSWSLQSPLRKSTFFGTRIFIISIPSFCLFHPQFLLTLIFIFLLLLLLNCV